MLSKVGDQREPPLVTRRNSWKARWLGNNRHIVVLIEHHVGGEAWVQRRNVTKVPEGLEVLDRRGCDYLSV
jgi:hypothetical protein